MSKYLKIGIYGIWGVFLFLASMEKFGDLFAVGTGFWSVIMLSVAGLCQLLASTAAIGWAVLGYGTLKAKFLPYKLVNNYTVPVVIIVLAFVASSARSSSDGARAQKLGFKDSKEFSIARENHITNTDDYAKFVEEQRVKAAEKKVQDALVAAEKANQDIVKKYISIFDKDKREQAQITISKDLEENAVLTESILTEIKSYPNNSVDRTAGQLTYLDIGVSMKEYMSAIEQSNCWQRLNNSLFPLNEWNKSQFNLLNERFNAMRNGIDMDRIQLGKELQYERDKITMQYFYEKNKYQKSFNECVFSLLSSISNRLSRPDARPAPVTDYIPEGIKCMRKPEGNIKYCY
ncbi:TPA: hypothetical protein ACQ7ZU_000808 [Escherichia coli]